MPGASQSAAAQAVQQLKVDVQPAPVQELAYAFYRVAGPSNPLVSATLPWLRQLESDPPDWFTEARQAFSGANWTRYEPLLMASALGYALDDSPERFLTDLPGLARVMARDLDTLNIGGHEKPPPPTSTGGKLRKQLHASFELLAGGAYMHTLQRTLEGLWAHLEPDWILEGRQTAQDAAATVLEQAGASGDVLGGLPPHHFVSLESSVADIRLRSEHVRLVVAPLYFASMGGFKFEIGRVVYLGFGVRSERLFHERRQHVHDLAANLKAFADPTRLMLLVLISRLRRFPLTVGDLARQLGVSQPTASGHLRLLRDLDLVEVVKRGNRSYYRVREAQIESMLSDLSEALILGYTPSDD
ncbi:MAG: metalloregulator ArsR/SmtB family transcription factor [Trueperaceae bacterium]